MQLRITFVSAMLILTLFLLHSCRQEEVHSNEFPRLRTLPVTDISAEGALLSGEILAPGAHEITEHGFIWSDDSSNISRQTFILFAEKIVLSGPIHSGNFSSQISTPLEADTQYFVRAYVKTEMHTVYGQTQKFGR